MRSIMLRRIRKIVGMEIKVINPEMELAQAQEIVALIKSFKSHGKWTDGVYRDCRRIGPRQYAVHRRERGR